MEKYRYVIGVDREQVELASLDEMITKDDVVRIIDKIINAMNILSLGFKYSETSSTGRPPYNPSDMLKLYIFCYFNKIRSSRKIEAECHQNIKVMWLIGKLTPDFKTISDFRKDNKEAIENVFVDFIMLCDSLGLLSKEVVAVDGSKFKANNSSARCHTLTKVEKRIEKLQKTIDEYMKLLDENDNAENKNPPPSFNKEDTLEKLDDLQEKMRELEDLKKEVQEKGSIATTDPDCKLMKMNNSGFNMAYNVQIAVDKKNYIAVAVDTTNAGNDNEQLYDISKQAKENSNVENITVLADGGYNSGKEFAKCEQDNITPIVNVPKNYKSSITEKYSKHNFKYDKETDKYICPEGYCLSKVSNSKSIKTKYTNVVACHNCEKLKECTKQKHRTIERGEFEDHSDTVNNRAKEKSDILKERKAIVEHVFGDVKYNFGYYYFLTRRRKSVRVETFLHFLVYNFKRVINILRCKRLSTC